jgi:hypothetical protein
MASKGVHRNWSIGINLRTATAVLALVVVCVLPTVVTQSAQAQTYKVIFNFTGGMDGASPFAGLTIDRGNLYGTTSSGEEDHVRVPLGTAAVRSLS